MNRRSVVFADSGYWIALLNPRDVLHERARQASETLGRAAIVTSELVLVELLDALSKRGPKLRMLAVSTIRDLREDANVTIVEQTHELFERALDLYSGRPDKEWGLTDCTSFVIMEERGIAEALAHDQHFAQAGFAALLRET